MESLKSWLYEQATLKLIQNGEKNPSNEQIAKELGYSSHTSVAKFTQGKRGKKSNTKW
jgi:hypothetical protein